MKNKSVLFLIILTNTIFAQEMLAQQRYKQYRVEVICSPELMIDDYISNEIEINYDAKNNKILFSLYSKNIDFGKSNIIFYYDFSNFLKRNFISDLESALEIEKEYRNIWEKSFVMNKNRMIFDGKCMIMNNPKASFTSDVVDSYKDNLSLNKNEMFYLGFDIKYDHYKYEYKPKTIDLEQEYLFFGKTPFLKNVFPEFWFPFDREVFKIFFGNGQDIKYDIRIKKISYLDFNIKASVLENRNPYKFKRIFRSIFDTWEYIKVADKILDSEMVKFEILIKRDIYCKLFTIFAFAFLAYKIYKKDYLEFFSYYFLQFFISMSVFKKPLFTVVDSLLIIIFGISLFAGVISIRKKGISKK